MSSHVGQVHYSAGSNRDNALCGSDFNRVGPVDSVTCVHCRAVLDGVRNMWIAQDANLGDAFKWRGEAVAQLRHSALDFVAPRKKGAMRVLKVLGLARHRAMRDVDGYWYVRLDKQSVKAALDVMRDAGMAP